MARQARRLMGVLLCGMLCAAGIGVASAIAASSNVRLSPHRGAPRTKFVLNFVAPDMPGRNGSVNVAYLVSATGPRHAHGCASQFSRAINHATVTQGRIRLVIAPKGIANGRWCRGRFHGVVSETRGPECQPLKVCPAFVSIIRMIGRFSYRVR